jgi:hypothetical protein
MATSVWMQVVAGVALLGADDAGGDAVLQAEGRADGHHPLAHLQPVAVADLHEGQPGGFELDHGHVGAPVGTDDAGLELALVGERDQHFVGTIDDMRIRHHVAVGTEDEARAHAALLRLVVAAATRPAPLTRATRQRDAEAAEELLHIRVDLAAAPAGHSRAAALQGADVDHRRANAFNQFGEVRQRLRARRRGPGTQGRQQHHADEKCPQSGFGVTVDDAGTHANSWKLLSGGTEAMWGSTPPFKGLVELL